MIQEDILAVMPLKEPITFDSITSDIYPGEIVSSKSNHPKYQCVQGMMRRLRINGQVTRRKIDNKIKFIRNW